MTSSLLSGVRAWRDRIAGSPAAVLRRIAPAAAGVAGASARERPSVPGAGGAAGSAAARARHSLLVPLLALGTVSLLTGLALMDLPIGIAHIALVTGVGLTGAAAATALVNRIRRGDEKELARFHALGDRLEKGIEKLKDLQWELSDNESRYRDLLDSQNDIITRVDTQGRLTFVNRAFCRTFGVEAGDVLGTPFALEVLQHEGEPASPVIAGRRQRFEQLVMTAEGARWLAFEQHAITGEEGGIRELQLLGRDVTEQRRTQAALAEARDQAEAANRAKSRFLAAMSHEIRTPMNGILGMTSLLAETPLTGEQASYVSAIDHSAKNLLNIIDEILDLSKIEAGKLEIHTAPFPLDECVQSVTELMAPRAREKGLDLAWRIDPGLPKTVIGDETRVRQILLNLVGNAIKFTDQGGIGVRVRGLRAGEAAKPGTMGIELEVSDTGIGIDPERAATLFAEFEQADDVVRRKRSGSGLGLAISRRLARAMGGDIELESRHGHGSVFKARIVVGASDSGRIVLPLVSRREIRRVAVVSDRGCSREIIREILASVGIRCEGLSGRLAPEAIARAGRERDPFDAIVADADLGAELIARATAEARTAAGEPTHTILIVDHPGAARLKEFRAAGCDAYLVRPVRPSSLLIQLDRARLAESEGREAEAAATRPEPQAPPPVRSRNILLVEDNDINALLARRMSERAGCRVHHAACGPHAIAHCEQLLDTSEANVDLVLMDIHMPEMDGIETARRIKRLFASRGRNAPPIVALTANAFAEDRKRCLEQGLDDYLAKPFDRAELKALLDKWCPETRPTPDGRIDGFAA